MNRTADKQKWVRALEEREWPTQNAFDARAARSPLEITNYHLRAIGFKDLLHDLEVQRMALICILGLLVGKGQFQRHLIGLVYYGSMAWDHFADVKLKHPWNGLEVAIHAGQQFIHGLGILRLVPENDDV